MNGKMKMRWICFLLSLALLLGMMPISAVTVSAAEIVTSGISGTATWSLDANGLFTISDGEIADYGSAAEQPWASYAQEIKIVNSIGSSNVAAVYDISLVKVTQPYGRKALGQLPNAEALLYAYDQIVAGVEASVETITVYDNVNSITQAELEMVMDVYRRDYAHHFWLGTEYVMFGNAHSMVEVHPTYIMTGTVLEEAKAEFEAKATDILSGINGSMSEYEKELYLHDKLAELIVYEGGANAHNAYGALVEGKAVCEGYAEAFQYLLQRVGICSYIALGTSLNSTTGTYENHAWNYVQIDDNYYHVDLTWDDQEEYLFHAYFNQTDAVMLEDHTINITTYDLPACNSIDAQYFTGKEEYLASYTAEKVGKLLKDNGLQAHVYVPGSVDAFIGWIVDNILSIVTEAGITGAFSCEYVQLGRELILEINTVTEDSDIQFEIAFANMTLQNSLAMNFAFAQGHVSDWTGYYVEIVKTYADGRPDAVVQIPYGNQWYTATIGGTAHYYVTFDGITAKEMCDVIRITVYDAEGRAVTPVWEDSVRGYAMRMMDQPANRNNPETMTMAVDMLNYGAASQEFFSYNTGDLANSLLSAEQKELASKTDPEVSNKRETSENYVGTSLTLESKILLNMAFKNGVQGMYTTVSFVNHYGRTVNAAADLTINGGFAVVDIDEIAVADARQMLTVTVYNADGSVHATAKDSVESYIFRISNLDPLFTMIMKFADSAYAFFH